MGARDIDAAQIDQAEALFARIWREYCAPPPKQTVTEWAEANRVLSAKDSSEPGPYRVRRTPYAREPQDCLGALNAVEEVVLMFGSQTSKTTIGLNWIGYTIEHNPGPMMVLWPTIGVAKRNSRQRLTPMFDATPSLRRKVSERKSRDEANTMLLKDFSGGVLAIVGANSGSDLSSMPMRDIFMDELDRFPKDIPGEGRPSELAEARQTTFARRKRLKTSTPTTKGASDIEDAYEASDRCRYHVPCPHCGQYQALEWGADRPHGLKWDSDDKGRVLKASVRYVCAVNGCEIREHHKTAMLAAGKWIAQNPGAQDGKVRGFHLSSLYSPLGWMSWLELARQWVKALEALALGDPSLLRVFVNTRLAETYEDQGERASEHELRQRAEAIELGVVTWPLFVRTLGIDVQGNRIEIYDWAWGRGMESQLVDRRICHGDPSLPEDAPGSPWAAVTEYRNTAVLHASGKPVPLLATCIDSGGHHTQAVYVYCRAHQAEHVHAIKGMSTAGKPILGKPTEQDINWRGQRVRRGVKLWPIGTDTAKATFYGRLRVTQSGPGYVHLSRELPGDVFEQLTAERLVTRYVKGRKRLEWVKLPGRANEGLDATNYALAAAHWAGIDRWRAGDWAKWERRVAVPPAPPVDTKADAPQEAAPRTPALGPRINLAGMKRFGG